MSDDQGLVQIEIPDLSASAPQNPPINPSNLEADHPRDENEKPPSEYALHILFTQFVRITERKLANFTDSTQIERVMGEGADEDFDLVVRSLGHVACRRPKPVIDSVMYWRKSKRDVASAHPGAERRSLASIYILSRVLMEVVRQTPPEVLGDELSSKLEDIVFKQLLQADIITLRVPSVRRANWKLLSQLLGELARSRFGSVCDRFTTQLSECPQEHLIEAMRYLPLRLYPVEYVEESALFLESLTALYSRAPATTIKDLYASILTSMLLPLAEVVTVEVNHPAWASAVERLYLEACEARKIDWDPHFRLAVAVLCISPQPLFLREWPSLVEIGARQRGTTKWLPRLESVYEGTAQLLWTYVFRCSESLNATTRRLAELKRLLLMPSGRKYWQSLPPPAANSLAKLVVIAFRAYPQFAVDEMLFVLLSGLDSSQIMARPSGIENPERALISVRAFNQIMRGGEVPFPISFSEPESEDYSKCSSNVKLSAALQASVDLYGKCLDQLVIELDDQPRQNSVVHLVGLATNGHNPPPRELTIAILRSIQWWPPDPHRLELLGRSLVQYDTAADVLRNLAKTEDARAVITAFTKSLLYEDLLGHPTTHLQLYVELLEIWVHRVSQEPSLGKDPGLYATIEEVEGNGLFFLCSQDRAVRSLALRVLWLTAEMDRAVSSRHDQPSRVIELLQAAELGPLVKPLETSMSAPERARAAKFQARRGTTLARLVESDYGVDAAIWLRLFPAVIRKCFDQYPIPVALCRSLVCRRLVEMHEQVTAVADSRMRSAAVEQWRIYVMLACATLTSTDEQKLHVPSHTRKKSTQKITLHHQQITSAKSVFRIVLPLLNVSNATIRDAVVAGVSCINVATYRTLLECLRPYLADAPRPATGATQILALTTWCLKNLEVDAWIRAELAGMLQTLRMLIMQSQMDTDASYLGLRRWFCTFAADAYEILGENALFPPGGAQSAQQRSSLWTVVGGWTAYGDQATRVAERSATIRRHASSAVVVAAYEVEKREFEKAANRLLAVLLSPSLPPSLDFHMLLRWAETLLTAPSPLRDSGKIALMALVKADSRPQIIWHGYRRKLGVWFIQALGDNNIQTPASIALALYKIGDPDLETRVQAYRSIKLLPGVLPYQIRSSAPAVYKREIFRLSGLVATSNPELTPDIVSELTHAFYCVADNERRDVLSVLLPWIHNIELSPPIVGFNATSSMVLSNLLEVTVTFASRLQNEVEALWVAVCSRQQNILVVLEFLVTCCLRRPSVGLVTVCRHVLTYLVVSPNITVVVEKLLNYLEPDQLVAPNSYQFDSSEAVENFSYVADIKQITAAPGDEAESFPFLKGQLALVFLVDTLAYAPPDRLREAAPTLLHISVCHADHFLGLLQHKSRMFIGNIAAILGGEQDLEDLFELRWAYDEASTTPDALREFVRGILPVFEPLIPNFSALWCKAAVEWATACPVRHVACRSFQIFRCLEPHVDQAIMAAMLARLSTTLAEIEAQDIQGFAFQILATLTAVAPVTSLALYPQLFWATVATLGSPLEKEHAEALRTLIAMLEVWDTDSEPQVLDAFPAQWESEFPGLVKLCLPGLQSTQTMTTSYTALRKLAEVWPPGLVEEREIPLILAAFLPSLLLDPSQSTLSLRGLCHGSELARILDSYENSKFWSTRDFIQQYVGVLDTEFGDDTTTIVLLYFGLLFNKILRPRVLEILKLLLPRVRQRLQLGADAVSPLLRLLQTKDAAEALDILDEVGNIAADANDKHILRMSLGSRLVRKEYENAVTEFGIPDENGWAVPNPVSLGAIAKANVHAVFYTCATASDRTSIFEFTAEQTPPVVPEQGEPLDEMHTVLDDLDSFFTQMAHAPHTRQPSTASDDRENTQLYDKKVSAILKRSLVRTPSQVSFRTSFADPVPLSSVDEVLSEPGSSEYPSMLQKTLSSEGGASIFASHSEVDQNLGPNQELKPEPDSSFRFESLLRGKLRRGKNRSSDFKFPPRD